MEWEVNVTAVTADLGPHDLTHVARRAHGSMVDCYLGAFTANGAIPEIRLPLRG